MALGWSLHGEDDPVLRSVIMTRIMKLEVATESFVGNIV